MLPVTLPLPVAVALLVLPVPVAMWQCKTNLNLNNKQKICASGGGPWPGWPRGPGPGGPVTLRLTLAPGHPQSGPQCYTATVCQCVCGPLSGTECRPGPPSGPPTQWPDSQARVSGRPTVSLWQCSHCLTTTSDYLPLLTGSLTRPLLLIVPLSLMARRRYQAPGKLETYISTRHCREQHRGGGPPPRRATLCCYRGRLSVFEKKKK